MKTPEEEREMLLWAFQNNTDAVEFYGYVCEISQTFDDIWDGDNEVGREQALQMMLMAMVDLPRTKFYQVLGPEVITLIENTWMRWLESNDLEETKDEGLLQVSYITRSSTTDMLIEIAGILHGRAWRREVAARVRPWVYGDNEKFSEYLAEHKGE